MVIGVHTKLWVENKNGWEDTEMDPKGTGLEGVNCINVAG
jgi:hypothetical protein